MDDGLFTNYSGEGRELIRKAYDFAENALRDLVRAGLVIEKPEGYTLRA